MSVRRLAEDQFQPAAFSFSEENAVWAEATIRKYPEGRQQSAVILLLMRAQEQDGWVTRSAIEFVADKLSMPYIRVLEVATFYTQFQLKPVGTRAHVQVCGTTPCMLRGAEDLIKVCKSKISANPLEPNADGTLSWEEVECQGACVNAPMVMIFKDSYEDLTPTQLEHIIDRFEAGKGADIKPGPQVDRVYSAPVGGLTSLTEEIKPVNILGDVPPAAPPASVQPANAARPNTAADETNPALKTPATDKPAAAANAKVSGETADKAGEPVVTTAEGSPSARAAAAPKPSLDDPARPAGIEKPTTVDDLKLISGVGPKIEGTLHSLGIFTYAQVAGWTSAERQWVDGYLRFSGRIERDDWVKQAEALARGGEAEYIRVFGKKPR
ncbi:NADH-quinone oxidoreductase subunit NuoE [Rhizobium sp. CG5]|uniref:NADH-quinone oxidoreductase subunit NuoE n=1 Tax=Rhizobium sp. CG5 TaxID=2726076 RepID=UPI0020345D85|nr:NADH-quinone oxidoreductase subunit NuoE [Rhizobium sp. CG5]MCM2473832.1 NADH-quinone oxidoreductase subunit NuoE [Rhizobium sp. CG5]